jgi:hypothetical protein
MGCAYLNIASWGLCVEYMNYRALYLLSGGEGEGGGFIMKERKIWGS